MKSTKPNIIFRCDASKIIGSGHVVRCRTLARELTKYGFNIIFICREIEGDLTEVLEKEFKVLRLTYLSAGHSEIVDFIYNFTNKSETSLSENLQIIDAKECTDLINKAGCISFQWLVVDHYGLDCAWENKMRRIYKSFSFRILAIDDLANRRHDVDAILDQNYFGKFATYRYKGLISNKTLKFFGPRYSMLDESYSKHKRSSMTRKSLKRLVVFYSGADPMGITIRALKVLNEIRYENINVDVIISSNSPHFLQVKEFVDSKENFELYSDLPTLSHLFLKADLALGAGGSTTWERRSKLYK